MPVDFTPVEITVYRPPKIIEKFLKKLPDTDFEKKSDTCILFLTPECAKRFMRRFNVADALIRNTVNHDFHQCRVKEIKKPKIRQSDLTVSRRKMFPEYITASVDGKYGFRCLTRPGGYIYCSGQKIKLSGRKWKKTGFYAVFDE